MSVLSPKMMRRSSIPRAVYGEIRELFKNRRDLSRPIFHCSDNDKYDKAIDRHIKACFDQNDMTCESALIEALSLAVILHKEDVFSIDISSCSKQYRNQLNPLVNTINLIIAIYSSRLLNTNKQSKETKGQKKITIPVLLSDASILYKSLGSTKIGDDSKLVYTLHKFLQLPTNAPMGDLGNAYTVRIH